MSDERWPELLMRGRTPTPRLHMWTQVGWQIALAQAAPLNHSWGSALPITSRGLVTRPLAHGSRTFTISLDFIDHQLSDRDL